MLLQRISNDILYRALCYSVTEDKWRPTISKASQYGRSVILVTFDLYMHIIVL